MALSVVIITRNEERNIARCINSVRTLSDDIVVVDSGSTDRTVAIATELGARVSMHTWAGYSAQKNHANALARHAYILSLDADEALSPELTASIRTAEQAGWHGAYGFNRLTNYCGRWVRHGGWDPDVKIRIFPKASARWTGDHVHETLELDPGTRVNHLAGDLLHWSYHSLSDHAERIERYSTLHARKMLAEGKRAGWVKRRLSPLFKFVQGYVFQMGLLDGSAGFHIARYSARAVALKYAKLHQLLAEHKA
ncbi:MAG TPA: glycosyltransferase family 2 protein [Flavobacteriales bacterium]|nr:glycosyltransferase family 2 protein [Flavobacteriales bacterium]